MPDVIWETELCFHFYSCKTDLKVNYSWNCLILWEFDYAEAVCRFLLFY